MVNSFGKFNAIYSNIGSVNRFKSIVEEVTKEFKPQETVFSRFDLESMEMLSFDFERTIIENDSIIYKAILSQKDEEIIVEYSKGKVLVEHLFWYYPERYLKGINMIKKIIQDEKDGVLIIGFELSIDVNRVEESIEEVKSDKSIHPVIIIHIGKTNKSISEHISDKSIITEQKIRIINSYIKNL